MFTVQLHVAIVQLQGKDEARQDRQCTMSGSSSHSMGPSQQLLWYLRRICVSEPARLQAFAVTQQWLHGQSLPHGTGGQDRPYYTSFCACPLVQYGRKLAPDTVRQTCLQPSAHAMLLPTLHQGPLPGMLLKDKRQAWQLATNWPHAPIMVIYAPTILKSKPGNLPDRASDRQS